jgi:putative ABC transport system permease protein
MIWFKLIRRDFQFNAVLWFLSVAGIAVGVGGWMGMEAATHRAGRAFNDSMNATFGEATHVVESRVGNLPADVYFRLARETDLTLAPLIETHGRWNGSSDNSSGDYVRLLGIDPLSYGQFQDVVGRGELPFDRFVSGDSVAVLSRDYRSQYEKGDRAVVTLDGREISFTVGGFLRDPTTTRTILVDIGWLSRIQFGGELSRILIKHDGPIPEEVRKLAGNQWIVVPTGSRTRSVRSMVGAFEWNLRALAYLSLFVGGFLVYSTMYLYTSRQVNVISLLKTMGVGRGSIALVLFGALALIGLVGSLLGVFVGVLMSLPLSELVRTTVDQLYSPLFAKTPGIGWFQLLTGLSLGLVMSLVGGFLPVLSRLNVSPRAWGRSQVESGATGVRETWLFLGGLVCWIGSVGVIQISTHVWAGFLACFLVAFGGSLVSPLLLQGLGALCRGGPWLTMAGRNVRFHGGRTGVMVAVLVAAFSMVLAVSIMVNSFRTAVDQWINNVVKADYYVRSTPGSHNRDKPPLDRDFISEVRSLDGVKAVGQLAEKTVLLPDGSPLTLRGIEPDVLRQRLDYQFRETLGDPWESLGEGRLWLSEPGSYRLGRSAGETLVLPSGSDRSDTRPVTIAAIYNDYSTEWAVAYVSLDWMRRRYEGVEPSSMAVFTDGKEMNGALSSLTKEHGYFVEERQRLKQRALERFDRTFAVTDVMKLVAALVAGIGLLILMISFNRARSTERGRLLALGSSRGHLTKLLLYEGGLIGLVGYGVAVPTGTVLSYLLVHVINRRSFGWLIPFTSSWEPYLQLAGLMSLSVALAMAVPVYRLWTVPVERFLGDEN